MKTQSIKNVETITRMMKTFGVERHRIEYVIQRDEIAPLFMVGHTRVFGPAAVDRIRQGLKLESRDARKQ